MDGYVALTEWINLTTSATYNIYQDFGKYEGIPISYFSNNKKQNNEMIFNLNSPIENDEVVYFLLNYPKKGFTGNYIIDAILDFSNCLNTEHKYELQTLANRLTDFEQAAADAFVEYELRVIKTIRVELDIKVAKIEYFYEYPHLLFPFEDFMLTNENNQQFKIHDMWGVYFFQDRSSYVHRLETKYPTISFNELIPTKDPRYNFRGFRTGRTNLEIDRNYFHSHISSANSYDGNMGTFCLGNWEYASNNFRDKKAPNYMYYLFMFYDIGKIVHHESLTGGPYKYLSSLYPQTKLNSEYFDILYNNTKSIFNLTFSVDYLQKEKLTRFEDRAVQYILENKINSFEIINGCLTLIMSEHLNEVLLELVDTEFNDKSDLIVYESPDGSLYNDVNAVLPQDKNAKEGQSDFLYKQKPIFYKTYIVNKDNLNEYTNQTIQQTNRKIHPDYFNTIKSFFEVFANQKIRRVRIETKGNTQNSLRNGEKNLLSMQKYSTRKRMEWNNTFQVSE